MAEDNQDEDPGSTVAAGVWRIVPVSGLDGEIQVFDIYIDAIGHGSQRTQQRCLEYLRRKGLDVGT